MSLSNPRQVNPASKFIEWSGSRGKFCFYDKTREANDKNVYFDKPIFIVPLDELSTIKGFHKQSTSGIYSNEVKNISKDILIVKAFKGGSIVTGTYNEIKGSLEGGKYAKSVYAVMITGDKDDTTLELVNISFVGSSLNAFIDAKINIDRGCIVSLSPSTDELKNGTTTYFAPQIKKHAIRKDIIFEKCIDMDKQLQCYLNGYLNKPSEEQESITDATIGNVMNNELGGEFAEDDLPF